MRIRGVRVLDGGVSPETVKDSGTCRAGVRGEPSTVRQPMNDQVLPDVIRTGRLELRPWRLGDVDDVFAYARDPEWSRFLRMLPRPYTRADAERFVAGQLLLDRTEHAAWAVTYQGRAIGGVNLRMNLDHGLAEIGYSIAKAQWNQGFCSEAARAVIDAGFSTVAELNRIHARADHRNTASQRVMEKVGMRKEGVLRQSRIERGEVIDEAWFAILRREWRSPTEGSS